MLVNALVCLSFLAKRGVKDEITNFDARKITSELRNSVNELLERNKKSFEEKVVWRMVMMDGWL